MVPINLHRATQLVSRVTIRAVISCGANRRNEARNLSIAIKSDAIKNDVEMCTYLKFQLDLSISIKEGRTRQ